MITLSRRGLLGAAGATTLAAPLAGTPQAAAAPSHDPARPSHGRLTNLAHLDSLLEQVRLVPSAAHTTYRLEAEPLVTMLWVYADALADGGWKPVGGGAYDAATDTWGQGAYDVDDIARAAVVYLRHWRQFGDADSRDKARELLRATAYFQTLTGDHAGEFLLWMQPDGTLNPTPTPPDNPNPADAGDSYWTARCVWALGEGHAAFARADPEFARFLAERTELAVAALLRDTPSEDTWKQLHGVRVPGWLVANGADATAEALIGLSAHVRAGGSERARRALRSWARGVALHHGGTTRSWPYRALLPWDGSLDDWHAWGAEMASGLAAAAPVLRDRTLLRPAIGDTAGFTAHLLTSTGPVNGLLPSPTERVQIAYGADCRVRGCRDVFRVTGHAGLMELAGLSAAWFFGANNAGVPVYDPATGATFDGVEADGRVNRNSGAESTIHGLLTMMVLDAEPRLRRLAMAAASIEERDGLTVLEAEDGRLAGGAIAQAPEKAWTGESQWSGRQVAAPAGSSVSWTLPDLGEELLVQPVVALQPGSAARTRITADGHLLGTVDHSAVGPQGDARWAGRLTPVALPGDARRGWRTLVATVSGGQALLDALLVMPRIATLRASGRSASVCLLTSKSPHPERRRLDLAGRGRLVARSYDAQGRLVGLNRGPRVVVPAGGFVVATRGL